MKTHIKEIPSSLNTLYGISTQGLSCRSLNRLVTSCKKCMEVITCKNCLRKLNRKQGR